MRPQIKYRTVIDYASMSMFCVVTNKKLLTIEVGSALFRRMRYSNYEVIGNWLSEVKAMLGIILTAQYFWRL